MSVSVEKNEAVYSAGLVATKRSRAAEGSDGLKS